MATTMILNQKRVSLSIEEKARLLTVFDINEPGRLAVTSGSKPNTAYVVHHDGKHVTHCPCKSTGLCAHKVAGDWYLEAQARAVYVELFDPHCCTVNMW